MVTFAKGKIIVKRLTRPIKATPLPAGARTDAAGKAVSNIILLSLPDKEYGLLRPCLEPADLPQYKIVHEPGRKMDSAYFLNEGMMSLVALNHDGRSVEVGIVGKEGMVGTSLMMGLRRRIFRSIMQISGSGLRIEAKSFQDALRHAPTLRSELCRFALMHGMHVAQLAACNQLHEIDQRLAR